jgi:hypothetical protein
MYNIGVALFIASILTGRYSDFQRAKAFRANLGGKVAPEQRIPVQIYGFIISAAGKVMYGWFSAKRVHPAAGLVAAALGMLLVIYYE